MENLGIRLDQIIFQIINFAIVFVVLSKFVYKPIVEFVKKQKKELAELESIAEQTTQQKLKLAQQQQEAESAAKAAYNQAVEKAQMEAFRIVESAKRTANTEGNRILKEYNDEAIQTKQTLLDESKKEVYILALKKTEELLKTSITPEQQKKLMEISLERLDLE